MTPARKRQRLSIDGTGQDVGEASQIDQSAEQQPQSKDETAAAASQGRSLFVRGLPASTTSDSLAAFFSNSYPVKHAVAVTDPATKEFRGYGFVTFADAEDAQKAKVEFNGQKFEDKKIRIEIAEARERKAEKNGVQGEAKAKRQQEQAEAHQPNKLIVRNLPWTIKNNEQLAKLFMSYGKIKEAYIPKRSGGLLPGFGFVIMRSKKHAEKAIEGENGKEIDGRTIAVDWAVKKEVYQQALESEAPEVAEEEETEQSASDEDDTSDVDGGEDDLDELHDNSEDDEDHDEDDEDDEDEFDMEANRNEDRSATLFLRNLPWTCTDESLEDHFSAFGPLRYARIVMDWASNKPRGTGFICFRSKEDAETCLRSAPSRTMPTQTQQKGKPSGSLSVLQNDDLDPSGRYTIDGRVVQVSRAVDKMEADKLTEEGVANRHKKAGDKRRIYLLSEGTMNTKSKLWQSLPPSEQKMRDASLKQRKSMLESNPSLHLSLTRLSVRNIPRGMGSKELKALARVAVVGFAEDVKSGKREKLNDEELARGGAEMKEAEKRRREAGKGIVKQAKIVFENEGGSKVQESSGAGRSRGYGFIEYHTHRNALMGLRWLNGHSVTAKDVNPDGNKDGEGLQDRKKRLIVEFAIENVQVVQRRGERQKKAREHGSNGTTPVDKVRGSKKRKLEAEVPDTKPVDDKVAQRNRIIGRKRAARKAKRGQK